MPNSLHPILIILDFILIDFGVYDFITEDYDWIIRDCVYAQKNLNSL